jgi:hypothetical protein
VFKILSENEIGALRPAAIDFAFFRNEFRAFGSSPRSTHSLLHVVATELVYGRRPRSNRIDASMCYSFEASVIASLGLATAGVAMVRKSLQFDRRMVVFSCFPLGFSVHQLVEAGVWRSIDHPLEESGFFRYAYVIIAFLVWPVLAPWAALAAETRPNRKVFWKFLLLCGVGLTLYLIEKLLASNGIDVTIKGHSLQYLVAYDQEPPPFAAFVYVVTTILSFLLIDDRIIRLIGVTILAAFFYSVLNMRAVWYSVWCMSAAVISLMFALAIRGEEGASIRSDKPSGDSSAVLQ